MEFWDLVPYRLKVYDGNFESVFFTVVLILVGLLFGCGDDGDPGEDSLEMYLGVDVARD